MKITLHNCIDYTGRCRDEVVLSDKTDFVAGDMAIADRAVFPTFCDVHVHLREPGFFYKETIASGTLAAAHGGYTDVCSMPNLNPVPDSVKHLNEQLDIIRRDARVRVHPYGSLTVREEGQVLSDIEGLAPFVIAFSDDGRGVQDKGMMREAMCRVRETGRILAAHCEDNSLLLGGYIHAGQYAEKNRHGGICSESEWRQVERDLELAAETGCPYHVCHISTKETVSLIRDAKKSGVDVTCETGPHYLVLDDRFLQEDGRFKMNPPLRDRTDREALIEGVVDGTVDMIATDHAPHSAEEKSKGLKGSLMGVVGLETAFPVLYTELVKKGVIPMERLIDMMSIVPRRRFRLPDTEDFCVCDLNEPYVINPDDFLSKGRSSPFTGNTVYGRCELTVCDGNIVYRR